MSQVFVAGVGLVRVGDHWTRSITDLAVEAGQKAVRSSNSIRPDRIVVGNMFSGVSSRQEHLGALIANALGMAGTYALKVEAACSSGGAAVSVGYSMVKSGETKSVLVVGVEKMRDLLPNQISSALCMAESAEYTQFFGASFVSLNAMLTRHYMNEYNVSREQMSSFPVLAHTNALTAEHAQFRRRIRYDDVERSQMISDPLRLLDCSPVGDGAAAVLLVGSDLKDSSRVEILSSAIATNRFSLYERDDMLEFSATREAAKDALDSAGIQLKDIDFMEIHDAFPIVASLSLEAMGVSKRGLAASDAREGRFSLKGELPICTFGGLKARGHPAGATGVYQVAEAYLQLVGEAGENQVQDAKIGLAHSVGGIDTTAVVHILRSVVE